jgi:hypothetical protein
MRCGKRNCRCIQGQLHGPYLIVKHYAGYNSVSNQRITRTCYIGKRKKFMFDERKRIAMLLKKYEKGKGI